MKYILLLLIVLVVLSCEFDYKQEYDDGEVITRGHKALIRYFSQYFK